MAAKKNEASGPNKRSAKATAPGEPPRARLRGQIDFGSFPSRDKPALAASHYTAIRFHSPDRISRDGLSARIAESSSAPRGRLRPRAIEFQGAREAHPRESALLPPHPSVLAPSRRACDMQTSAFFTGRARARGAEVADGPFVSRARAGLVRPAS